MDAITLWKQVLAALEKTTSRGTYLALFSQTELLSCDHGIATISAPNAMILDMLQKRFSTEIKKQVDTLTGEENHVLFIQQVQPIAQKIDEIHTPLFAQAPAPLNNVMRPPQPAAPLIGHLPRVRPEFTFQNFAVSGSNQLAFVSAQTVSENLGTSYNPFFIYGPVGVGKTHLMHAIANAAYQRQPDRKVIYITSEEFTNDVVEAIRGNRTGDMKRRFRSAVLLLIDDIQFIEGKKAVQEEIFHTFNTLIDQGSQIALSSDRPPHEIKNIMDRLASRFAGGLTVDIETPDFELKTAILLIKAKKYNVELPMQAAQLIANHAQDTRSLEGLLLRVITQAASLGELITEELTNRALGGIVQEKSSILHADDVIATVCEFYSVKPTQLKGPKRDAGLVKARQVSMYLLKTQLGITHVEIGNLLGGRDHTTVMHGVGKIEALVENKAPISEEITGITKTLRG